MDQFKEMCSGERYVWTGSKEESGKVTSTAKYMKTKPLHQIVEPK